VSIQGDLEVAGNIAIQSAGNADFSQFRGRAGGRIDVLANQNVTTNGGALIATGGAVDLQADADHNGSGTLTQTGTTLSQPTTLDLAANLNTVKLPTVVRAGDKGKVFVTVTNSAFGTAKGPITLVLYAAVGKGLQARDHVIGKRRLFIKMPGGASKSYAVKIKVPGSVTPGNYYVAAEQLPYRGAVSSGGDGTGLIVSDPNVSFTSNTYSVRIPTFTGTVSSTFDQTAVSPGRSGTVTVNVVNSGSVRSLGRASMAVYASIDGTMNNAVLLGSQITTLNLKPGRSLRTKVRVKAPGGFDSTQTYKTIVVITPIASSINPVQPATTLVSGSSFS
jgi:hypothetical protein